MSADGRDDSPGTNTRPFRSLTKALSVVDDDDIIYVKYGTYSHRAQTPQNPLDPGGTGEVFPLTSSARGIQIIGLPSGENSELLPKITAHDTSATPKDYAGWTATYKYMLLARDGWYIRNLEINNKDYDKYNLGAGNLVIGIGVVDLGQAGAPTTAPVTISHCTLDDNFVGVFVYDTLTSATSYQAGRSVTVTGSRLKNHGPVNGLGDPHFDKGHQAIWTATWQNLTLNVDLCAFENNHDAIESGNLSPFFTAVNLSNSTILKGENGLEVAAGKFVVTGTTFERNEAQGSSLGGIVGGPTTALGVRGENQTGANQLDVKVRNCTFLNNQLSAKLSHLDALAFDLGTTAEPGGNVFALNPTSPWVAPLVSYATADNISFVNLWQANQQIDITAIGNTWTYRDYGACVGTGANQDYNQGVCVNLLDPNDPTNGTFDCYVSKEFVDPAGSGGLNVTATNTPNKRPLVTGSTEATCTTNSPPTYYNHPFNFAISDGAKKIIVK